jgi:hypothetical protein
MKKLNQTNQLSLKKIVISQLDLKHIKGGDDIMVGGMSMVDTNTKYLGCIINNVDGEHITRRKCEFNP